MDTIPSRISQIWTISSMRTDVRNRRRQCLDLMIHRGLALKKRFGDHITLGELTAAWIAHRALLLNEPLTISDLADRAGQNKQSISRRIKRVPFVTLEEHPTDSRSKVIKPTDPRALESMLEYVDEIAELDMATLAEYHQLWSDTRNEVGNEAV